MRRRGTGPVQPSKGEHRLPFDDDELELHRPDELANSMCQEPTTSPIPPQAPAHTAPEVVCDAPKVQLPAVVPPARLVFNEPVTQPAYAVTVQGSTASMLTVETGPEVHTCADPVAVPLEATRPALARPIAVSAPRALVRPAPLDDRTYPLSPPTSPPQRWAVATSLEPPFEQTRVKNNDPHAGELLPGARGRDTRGYGSAPLLSERAQPASEVRLFDVYGESVGSVLQATMRQNQFDEDHYPSKVQTVAKARTWVMLIAAVALLGTWAYREHVVEYYAERAQQAATRSLPVVATDILEEGEWNSPIVGLVQPSGDVVPDTSSSSSAPVLVAAPVVAAGAGIGRVSAPSINLEWTFMNGVGVPDLKKGPGWMPWTSFPGAPGNSVLSGHRTTYGAPFRHLDSLELGDRITVSAPGKADAVFEVRSVYIVQPNDAWVASQTDGVRLTLTTCDPVGSDRERLIVQAELVEGVNTSVAVPAGTWTPSTPG